MKADKKLKNLIEKQGRDIKEKNCGFYEQMLSGYKVEEKPIIKKPSFWEWFTVKRVSALATAFVLVIAVSVFGSLLVNKTNTNVDNAPQISLPDYAEIVPMVENKELMLDNFVETEFTPTLSYGDHLIALEEGSSIYTDSLNGEKVFYYVTETYKDGFYRLQLITDLNYPYTSHITGKTQRLDIKGVTFVCSTFYALNDKLVYFFAESVLPSGEILAIDFTTKAVECEKTFINLLNTLIYS